MGVGDQRHAQTALPPGETRFPFCRRLGGPQGRSGRVRKISPPPGCDPRTVHPVASRYTDCAVPAPRQPIREVLFLNMPGKVMRYDRALRFNPYPANVENMASSS